MAVNQYPTGDPCSVCQLLNKFTAIRYMLRVRIADNENSIEELSIHRSKLIQDCTLKLFNEYIAISDRIDKQGERQW